MGSFCAFHKALAPLKYSGSMACKRRMNFSSFSNRPTARYRVNTLYSALHHQASDCVNIKFTASDVSLCRLQELLQLLKRAHRKVPGLHDVLCSAPRNHYQQVIIECASVVLMTRELLKQARRKVPGQHVTSAPHHQASD